MRHEYFLRGFEALEELNKLSEALGCGVKLLDYEFFFTLLQEVELYQIEDLVFW